MDAVSFSMVMCSVMSSVHCEIYSFFNLFFLFFSFFEEEFFRFKRIVFLVTISAMSAVFTLGSITEDRSPSKQNNREESVSLT